MVIQKEKIYGREMDNKDVAISVVSVLPLGKLFTVTKEFRVMENATKEGSQGGLNLFKWEAEQTGKKTGWKAGDYMLHLPNKETPALNWKANYGALKSEMNLSKPIFDSYRLSNGNLIPTGGFLNVKKIYFTKSWLVYNPIITNKINLIYGI